MSNKLYPIVYLPLTKSANVFLRAGDQILARLFSRPFIKPKILNWRLPDQTAIVGGAFDFMDGSSFDFMDGSDFDFMET